MKLRLIFILVAMATCAAGSAQAADKIIAAVNKLSAGAPLYIALDKGFFAQEGLEVSLLHLTSSQTIGLAVVSGDVQFGMTAITAGIYTLGERGGLKMIAGGYEEHPGFHGVAIVANKAAYERGLRTPRDLAGKKIAITAVGSGSQNQLARLAKKYGFRYAEMQLLPLQTLANEVSAVTGGQVDATLVPATLAQELEDKGAGRIIAWLGDEVPTQFGGIFAAPSAMAQRRDVVTRFLRAYVNAIQYYDRAFQQRTASGEPIKGENYAQALAIIAAHTGEPEASLAVALPYFDPQARLQVDDIAEQIEVYKSLKLVAPTLSTSAILDTSFVPIGRQ
jgi:NitT/TauT family transport system substrate-binding protein